MNTTDQENEAQRIGWQGEAAIEWTATAARGERPVPTCIVGVGASAGGLESLERLFYRMPPRSGMAFVVLQHLSPDFKSLMDELLARQTSIPIFRVEDGMPVQADSIYLIPPRKEMIISGGKLLLTDKDPGQGLSLPIDRFFRSLAQDAGARAAGIVLSGTGSDGSRGVRAIHEAGGLVIAESDETAKFDGMPRSAVDTGVVDYVLAPEQIPEVLLRHIRHAPQSAALVAGDGHAANGGVPALFRLLRKEYGIDFSHYKPTTVSRRIERRLSLNHSVDFEEYVERVANDPQELNSLYRDLLIGVTRFFRDRDAFERLKTAVLPELLVNTPADGEFRAWVAGCATGEEAYSLAILIHEQMEAMRRPVNVKIFATDVHRASLEFASAGVYPEDSLSEVSPARLNRYFQRRADGFHVSGDLRQMIVFAPHNVIRDAPFTRLDLVSCRNLLIYLQPPAQKKVLSLFHFGLKTGGVLLLGPSESPGELADEFETVDEHWKLYRKRRDVRLPTDVRLPMPVDASGAAVLSPLRSVPVTAPLPLERSREHHLLGIYDALLDDYMPPALLINEERSLLHAFGGASRYLRLRDGRVTSDLLDMLEGDLRLALVSALQRMAKEQGTVSCKGVRVRTDEGEERLNVVVRPVRSRQSHQVHTLITLEPLAVPAAPEPHAQIEVSQATRDQVRLLESELLYTRENLQATVEELEASNEELQATNEELLASNEELQSTNEELHSVNQELYTVNAEYQRKISELTELTNDMDNLLASTDVGTIFLDREYRIRKFTPQIAQTFQLLPQDVGRRIDCFTHTIDIDHRGLLDSVARVIETGAPFEREVRDRQGRDLFLRILPYRSQGRTSGTVLTLIDVSTLKRTESELRRKTQLLHGILHNSSTFIYVKDLQGRYLLANPLCRLILGASPEEVVGRTDYDLLPADLADHVREHERQVSSSGEVREFEDVIPGEGGERTWLAITFPLRDERSEVYAVGGVWTDITDRKRIQEEDRQAVIRRDHFLAMLSHELRNPLAAILHSVQLLHGQRPDEAELSECCEVILRQARQMTRLLDDLLDVSRVTHNKFELRRRVFDLTEATREAAQAVRPLAKEHSLELVVDVPPDPLFVDGDPARLQQIQVNLLTNAARYTPPGGRVRLTATREGGEAVVRVRDTGAGIPPEMIDRVFDLFVQLDGRSRGSDSGMGVGLTLVRSIVEMHGGRVAAHSDGPGRGSEFEVRLPLAAAPDGRPSAPQSSFSLDGTHRILLVEDNPDSRKLLEALLRRRGHEVASAGTAREGLALLAQNPPDVALVDLGLPDMDGRELARRIREHLGEGIILIALTGFGQESDRLTTREAGFDKHLVKPIGFDDLERAVAESLAGRAGSRATVREAQERQED